jgi:hypothetical protein
MAHRYICDACQIDVPPVRGYEPYGWFSLSQRYLTLATSVVPEEKLFCSVACLQQFVNALAGPAVATPLTTDRPVEAV